MEWFRFYNEVLNDPKVQTLSAPLFKAWVNLLCLASQNEPRGELGTPSQIAFALRMTTAQAGKTLQALRTAGLVESDALIDHDAPWLTIHNWNGRQFASDNVGERVRKHRRNVTVNVSETPPDTEQSRTEQKTETDSEQSATPEPRTTPKPSPRPLTSREKGQKILEDIEFMQDIENRFPIPSDDLGYQLEKWLDHIQTKPPKGNYKNSLRNWLENAIKFRSNGRSPPPDEEIDWLAQRYERGKALKGD